MTNLKYAFSRTLISESLHIQWGWFVALGSAALLLGLLAFGNLAMATSFTIFYIGIFMTVGGLLQVVNAFQIRSWSGFFYFIFSGVLYLAAGIIAFQNPLLAAVTLTLYLALALVISGVIRVWSGFQLRGQFGWGWILSSGLLTMAAGILFMNTWPINSIWLLGMVLAIDLTFQGIATVMFGLSLKRSETVANAYIGTPSPA